MGITAGIAAITSIGAQLYVADQQKELAEEQALANEKRNRLTQQRANIGAARERAKQIRQARVQRASALAQAQSGEGTGGSGLAGAQANIAGQTAGNLTFLGQQKGISQQLSNLNIQTGNRQARISGRIATGQAIGSVATSFTDVDAGIYGPRKEKTG